MKMALHASPSNPHAMKLELRNLNLRDAQREASIHLELLKSQQEKVSRKKRKRRRKKRKKKLLLKRRMSTHHQKIQSSILFVNGN
jgi:hypothetical protein